MLNFINPELRDELDELNERLIEHSSEMYELLNAVINSDYELDRDLIYDIECLIDCIDGKEHNSDLKHCPFCGSHAELDKDYFKGNNTPNKHVYMVNCKKCYITTPPCKTPDEAIKLWNTRKEDK